MDLRRAVLVEPLDRRSFLLLGHGVEGAGEDDAHGRTMADARRFTGSLRSTPISVA
jgi:hypothetical protein